MVSFKMSKATFPPSIWSVTSIIFIRETSCFSILSLYGIDQFLSSETAIFSSHFFIFNSIRVIMKSMIVDVLLIIFLIGLLVFLLSFLIHERKILKTLVFLIGSCLMLLSLGTAIYLLTALL